MEPMFAGKNKCLDLQVSGEKKTHRLSITHSHSVSSYHLSLVDQMCLGPGFIPFFCRGSKPATDSARFSGCFLSDLLKKKNSYDTQLANRNTKANSGHLR